VFEQRPLLGIGTGNFPPYFGRVDILETAARRPIHAHNIIMILLVENGILGLVVFVFLIGTAVVVALRRRQESPDEVAAVGRLAVVSMIVGHYAQQITDGLHLSPPTNTMLWIMLGLLFALCGNGYAQSKSELSNATPSLTEHAREATA